MKRDSRHIATPEALPRGAAGAAWGNVATTPRWFLGLLVLSAIETSLLTGSFWSTSPLSFTVTGSIYALGATVVSAAAALWARKNPAWTTDGRIYQRFAISLAVGIALLALVALVPPAVGKALAALSAALMAVAVLALFLRFVTEADVLGS